MSDEEGGVADLVSLGVLRERADGERRVALVPAGVAELKKLGFDVLVESSAGVASDGTHLHDNRQPLASVSAHSRRVSCSSPKLAARPRANARHVPKLSTSRTSL